MLVLAYKYLLLTQSYLSSTLEPNQQPVLPLPEQRLLSSSDCAGLQTCYDCGATNGQCSWVSEDKVCSKNENYNHAEAEKTPWYHFFEECTDSLDMCSQTTPKVQFQYSEYESTAVVQIRPPLDKNTTIPQNYYCRWTIDLIPSEYYIMFMLRDFQPKEKLELELVKKDGSVDQYHDWQLYTNRRPQYKSNEPHYDQYMLESLNELVIHARNLETSVNPTFEIQILQWSLVFGPITRLMARLIWVAGTIICCCVGFSCFIYCLKSRDSIFRHLDQARQRRHDEENQNNRGLPANHPRQQENVLM